MRMREMLEKGMTQKEISHITEIPTSAINLLINSAKGVGPQTAAAFVKFLGFETRGQLVDAADEWWKKGGYEFAIRGMREQETKRRGELEHSKPPSSDGTGESGAPAKKRRKSA